MAKVRFISNQPYEVLGKVCNKGDILEVDDEVAADLLTRDQLFEPADEREDAWNEDKQ